DGGAIFAEDGSTLTVIDSRFSDNSAATTGGGGAISNHGDARILRSSFTDNTAVGFGGAVLADASGASGEGNLVIVNSTFGANQAGSAAGGGGGAIASV